MPMNVFNGVLKSFLESNLHYFRIIEQNGLIYVFLADFPNHSINIQNIDIFSSKGQYLYSTIINPGSDYKMRFPIDTIKIHGNTLFLFLEDEDGETSLNKYKIVHPKKNH